MKKSIDPTTRGQVGGCNERGDKMCLVCVVPYFLIYHVGACFYGFYNWQMFFLLEHMQHEDDLAELAMDFPP